MSEPKKPIGQGNDELEVVLLKMQSLAVQIMTTGNELVMMEKRMAKLQERRDELRGGQSLFMLEKDK